MACILLVISVLNINNFKKSKTMKKLIFTLTALLAVTTLSAASPAINHSIDFKTSGMLMSSPLLQQGSPVMYFPQSGSKYISIYNLPRSNYFSFVIMDNSYNVMQIENFIEGFRVISIPKLISGGYYYASLSNNKDRYYVYDLIPAGYNSWYCVRK